MALKNYTLGRGKVYFSRFKTGTQTPEGFVYVGNTPEFSLTIESETLDHFSSDAGIREKDDSVPLEVTRTGSLTIDDIQPENIALFFFGESSTISTTSSVDNEETVESVVPGRFYQLGVTSINPVGVRGIASTGFSVEAAADLAATGVLTLGALPTANDTMTIGAQTYTFVAAVGSADDILIGASISDTLDNIVAAISAGDGAGTEYGTGTTANASATAVRGDGNTINLTAIALGVGGNSVATTETFTSAANVFGAATLTGGAAAPTYVEDTDYTIVRATGMLEIISTGSIPEGIDLTVTYDLAANTRVRVISGSEPVEGALRMIAENPKGEDYDYVLPWVKITPNGDYALKGDEWQQIPLTIEALKPDNSEAIYVDGRPAYL